MFRVNQLVTKFSRAVHTINQFKIPQTDCVPILPQRKVINPGRCGQKDTGLVLGVYYNENTVGEPAFLTASAQKYDKLCGGKLWHQLKLAPIPRLGECRVFYDLDDKFTYVAVAGLGTECLTYNVGERMDEYKEAIRIAAAVGATAISQLDPSNIHVESFGDAEAAAEGANLGLWGFKEYRTVKRKQWHRKTVLHLYDDCDVDGWKVGTLKAEAQNLTRYLQELPANILTPTKFAKLAVDLLCELDINVEVQTQGWAAAHEMGGFVSVGQSSVQPPLYVEISYYGTTENVRPIVLIGKGVTFDSGSLDLKPAKELRYMKGDMAGAACVLAITRAVARLGLPVNIRGILPLCELMPCGKSPKFGDVVCNASGKKIHIRLPSREGRLMLADSLVYARNYWPQFIVDIGTMSKEMIDTLDGGACGAYTNCEDLYCQLETASGLTGDRVWRMPLWRFYDDRILDCKSADLANTGRWKYGDSPNCAAFLRQFICDSKWIHLDTYNVAYTKGLDFPYLRRGMTGRPTRTVIEMINIMLANQRLSCAKQA